MGLGFHLYLSQQHQPDEAPLLRVIDLEPDSAVVHWGLGLAQDGLGRFADSAKSYERAVGLSGGSTTMDGNLARALALSGRTAEASERLAELQARGLAPYRVAAVEAALERRERALEALERGVAERDPWMILIAIDPMFRSLRSEPRFQAVVERIQPA